MPARRHPGACTCWCTSWRRTAAPSDEELGRLRQDRRRRNLALAERLAALGIPVTYEQVVTKAGGEEGVGRPHFAVALVEAGAAESIDDAFDRYLANGGPAYVRKARLSGAEVAGLARESGGVAVLAHPYSLGLDGPELARVVGELAESGFGGIEASTGGTPPDSAPSSATWPAASTWWPPGARTTTAPAKPDLRVGTGQGRPEGARQGARPARGPPAVGLTAAAPGGQFGSTREPASVQTRSGQPVPAPLVQTVAAGRQVEASASARSTRPSTTSRSPPVEPSTRKPTPASAARATSSARSVVHTTTRDGASVNSSWWSDTPAT